MSLEDRVAALEEAILQLSTDVGELKGEAHAQANLFKFVVVPLLVIIGGLVGVKVF